jgi:hypothetical protein
VARGERDLIVAVAEHRSLAREHRAALELVRALEAREEALRALAKRTIAAVTPAPKFAVPDVERLGRVPQDQPALDAFRARLDTVAKAMTQAENAYTTALAEVDELRGRLGAYHAKARATGRADDSEVAAAYRAASAVLESVPCPLPTARELVRAYQQLLTATGGQP